jgi:hypothetical protein
VAFAAVLGCKPFAADQCTLFTNEGFELSAITGFKSTLSAFTASLELPLAFAVLVQLTRSRSCKLWCRYPRRRLDERKRQQRQTRSSVAAVEDSADGDEGADGESQSTFSICKVLAHVNL